MQLDQHMTEAAASAANAAHDVVRANPALVGGTGTALVSASLAFFVMMIFRPEDHKEWAAALICTLVSSLGFGCFVILRFGLIVWVHTTDTADLAAAFAAYGALFFTCGLPGWVFVRIVFNTLGKYADKTVPEVVHDGAEMVRDVKGAL